MPHDVFISYSREDKLAADAACATLEAAGIRCWIAPRDILPGSEWGEAIVDAIDRSVVMVLIFSANANESRQIRREVERAVEKGVTIVPVRIEQAEPTRSLAYFMAGVHWLDALTPPLEQHLQRLAASIKAFLKAAPVDAPGSSEAAAVHVPPAAPPQARTGRPFVRRPGVIGITIAGAVLAVVLGLTLAGVFKPPPNQQASTTAPPEPARPESAQPALPPSTAPPPSQQASTPARDCDPLKYRNDTVAFKDDQTRLAYAEDVTHNRFGIDGNSAGTDFFDLLALDGKAQSTYVDNLTKIVNVHFSRLICSSYTLPK